MPGFSVELSIEETFDDVFDEATVVRRSFPRENTTTDRIANVVLEALQAHGFDYVTGVAFFSDKGLHTAAGILTKYFEQFGDEEYSDQFSLGLDGEKDD